MLLTKLDNHLLIACSGNLKLQTEPLRHVYEDEYGHQITVTAHPDRKPGHSCRVSSYAKTLVEINLDGTGWQVSITSLDGSTDVKYERNGLDRYEITTDTVSSALANGLQFHVED